MTMDDEQPEDGDQRDTERSHEPRRRTQRLERQADPFPVPLTPSPN